MFLFKFTFSLSMLWEIFIRIYFQIILNIYKMFYSHEILRKRGKFGLVWLAATSRKRLNRREICSANVEELSESVMTVLQDHRLGNRKCLLSLYTSSQLMYGVTFLHSRQTSLLLEDLRCFIGFFSSFKSISGANINLTKTVDKSKITLEDPLLKDIPFEFGNLRLPMEFEEHFYDFFSVHTPRSTIVSDVQVGDQFALSEIGSIIEGYKDLNISHHEDITMMDVPAFQTEDPIPMEIPEERVDFLAGPVSFYSPPELPVDRPASLPHSERIVPPATVLPTTTPPEDLTAGITVSGGAVPDITPSILPMPAPVVSPAFITPPGAQSLLESFALSPVIPAPRRVFRKRALIIDHVTTLKSSQLRNNLSTANDRLTTPLQLPLISESAESLLRRPGIGNVPSGIAKRYKYLATLPEPTDPAAFGNFTPESPGEETARERRQTSTEEPVEIQRDRGVQEDFITPSASGILKSLSKTLKIQEASAGTSYMPSGVQMSLPTLGLEQEHGGSVDYFAIPQLADEPMEEAPYMIPDVPPVMPPEDEIYEDVQGQHDIRSRDLKRCIFDVSPERTGPPPSPVVTQSSALECTMDLIRNAIEESPLLNFTTFSAVLERTDKLKKTVAMHFKHLLNLHQRAAIYLSQDRPYDEIFIEIRSSGSI